MELVILGLLLVFPALLIGLVWFVYAKYKKDTHPSSRMWLDALVLGVVAQYVFFLVQGFSFTSGSFRFCTIDSCAEGTSLLFGLSGALSNVAAVNVVFLGLPTILSGGVVFLILKILRHRS
jgi:hypothetical protein